MHWSKLTILSTIVGTNLTDYLDIANLISLPKVRVIFVLCFILATLLKGSCFELSCMRTWLTSKSQDYFGQEHAHPSSMALHYTPKTLIQRAIMGCSVSFTGCVGPYFAHVEILRCTKIQLSRALL